MKNTFNEDNNQLPKADYTDWLKALLKFIEEPSNHPLFHISSSQLGIDADAIARQVALAASDHPVVDALIRGKVTTINFGSHKKRNAFINHTKDLQQAVQQILTKQLQEELPGVSLEAYASKLLQPLLDYAKPNAPKGLQYPFKTPSRQLSSQRLTLNTVPPENAALFQGHTVSITIKKTQQFVLDLEDGIMRYVQRRTKKYSQSDLQDLQKRIGEMIKEDTSELYNLLHIVSTESLAKLKQEASIHYLDLLAQQVKNDSRVVFLKTLSARLKSVKNYLLAHEDGEYQVSYAGTTVDLRELFARANAFEILPVIPIISGLLSETSNDETGELTFQFGIKLKFNSQVTSAKSPSVLDYYLDKIDPQGEEHLSHLSDQPDQEDEFFKERVLHIACLYMLVFNRFNEEASDSVAIFREQVLPILQNGTEEDKKSLFLRIKKNVAGSLKVRNALQELCALLQKTIRQPKYQGGLQGEPYEVHIGVHAGIISPSIPGMFSQNRFLREDCLGNPRSILKYLTVSDARLEGKAFCKLQAEIVFTPVYYHMLSNKDHLQQFTFHYEIDTFDVLPIIFYPRKSERADRVREKLYLTPRILIPYWAAFQNQPVSEGNKTKKDIQRFAYEWFFTLLTYTCLKVLVQVLTPTLNQSQRRVFLPLIRLHASPKDQKREEERLIEASARSIAHLLSEDVLANTQGFFLNDLDSGDQNDKVKNKLENGLSSLYSVLPKEFLFDRPTLLSTLENASPPTSGLGKVAIIVVSSRSCDIKHGHEFAWANVYGEAIGIDWRSPTRMGVQTLRTFAANVPTKKRSEVPGVVVETVQACYEWGYHHIFYIAKSPYTSTLHLTQEEKDEELFFMNVRVLQAMKEGRQDLKLYPVFFDKYHVVKKAGLAPSSFLISHVDELTRVIEDPSKKSVAFFNLLNGFSIKKQEGYHGIISYSTLLNRYEGVIDDQDIWLGLIAGNENEPNALKNDLLQSLMLFHFARYEKHFVQTLKLDPYEHIIGPESIGALAFLPHSLKKTRFHTLAFLTEVRRIFNTSLYQLLEKQDETDETPSEKLLDQNVTDAKDEEELSDGETS